MKHHNKNHILLAICSFVLWGLFPIYLKLLHDVSPFEIVLHRIIWSFIFLFCIMLISRQFHTLRSILKNPKTIFKLFLAALLICSNWLIFVYGLASNRILETSLGYYISPLISILLGILFLKERVGTIKKCAIGLIVLALIVTFITQDKVSFIAIGVALSFSFYGFIKKSIKVHSLVSFFVEITVLFIPAIVVLGIMMNRQTSALNTMVHTGGAVPTLFLLIGLGIATPAPLLLFSHSVKHIDLNIIGFIQYITPSMTFLFATLIYKERLDIKDIIVFILIWIAIFLVNIENYRDKKR